MMALGRVAVINTITVLQESLYIKFIGKLIISGHCYVKCYSKNVL